MNSHDRIHLSKFLSLVLRHRPGLIGITLDSAGWFGVEELLAATQRHGQPISREQLDEVVAHCEKQRFAFSDDRTRIRASQGHSVDVELGYSPAAPPDLLYHGTVHRFLPSIRAAGLIKGKRHHVHLSRDVETATKVGDRRGKAVILMIDARSMSADGLSFFVSDNGVWLTDHVPPQYITFPRET